MRCQLLERSRWIEFGFTVSFGGVRIQLLEHSLTRRRETYA